MGKMKRQTKVTLLTSHKHPLGVCSYTVLYTRHIDIAKIGEVGLREFWNDDRHRNFYYENRNKTHD